MLVIIRREIIGHFHDLLSKPIKSEHNIAASGKLFHEPIKNEPRYSSTRNSPTNSEKQDIDMEPEVWEEIQEREQGFQLCVTLKVCLRSVIW